MDASHTTTVTVSAKGWVVIPAPIRKKINLKPGMKMVVNEVEGKIVLEPHPPQPMEAVDTLFGKLAGEESLVDALMAEKAKDERREKTKIHT